MLQADLARVAGQIPAIMRMRVAMKLERARFLHGKNLRPAQHDWIGVTGCQQSLGLQMT